MNITIYQENIIERCSDGSMEICLNTDVIPDCLLAEAFKRNVQSMNADEFRRLLCDMTGKMYCVSSDELLDVIKERL